MCRDDAAKRPALTTFSMIAERAGVQRHTLYAHSPDERSLNLAGSALVVERAGDHNRETSGRPLANLAPGKIGRGSTAPGAGASLPNVA